MIGAIPARGLIVRQPWIDLILDGKKTWEMRSRKTRITGHIGLIEQGSGLVVGQAILTGGWHKPSKQELENNKHKHMVDDFSLMEKWCYAWKLEGAQRFATPIPYMHPPGAVIWVDLSGLNEGNK